MRRPTSKTPQRIATRDANRRGTREQCESDRDPLRRCALPSPLGGLGRSALHSCRGEARNGATMGGEEKGAEASEKPRRPGRR